MQHTRHQLWWLSPSDTVAEDLFSMFRMIDENQSYRRLHNERMMQLYSRRHAAALFGGDRNIPAGPHRLRINLTKNIVDAALAELAGQRSRPMYLTQKGNRKQRRKAEGLAKFIAGQYYALDHYHKATSMFIHAATMGTGFLKFSQDGTRIFEEHVHTNEVVVDDYESRYGDPKTLYQHKFVPRAVLLNHPLWKKLKAEVSVASQVRDDESSSGDMVERVSVVEAWRLPSYPGAKDGRHVIAIDQGAAVDEKWTFDNFPFASFRLSQAPEGFWGIGFAEELDPLQEELDLTLQRIQECANNSSMQLWVHKADAKNVGRISNQVGAQNFFAKQPPVALNVGGIPPELLQHVQYIEQKAYNQSGISQLAATSQKPAGLNSGEAIKTYNDTGAKRFQHVAKWWERLHSRECPERILDCAEAIEAGDGSLKVLVAGDKDVEELTFKDISIERDKYVCKAWPVSLFPDTPSGKLDTAEQLAKVSPYFQKHLVSLLDLPDLDRVRSKELASDELIEQQIDLILDEGIVMDPVPQAMDLKTALNEGSRALAAAYRDKVEPERIELLIGWIGKVDKALADASQGAQPAAPPMPPGGPAPGQPPGPPAPGPALPPGPM